MSRKPKSELEEDLEGIEFMGAQCPVYKRVRVLSEYDIILDEAVVSPAYYRNALATLRAAGPDDRINIYINTPGGSLATALMFRNAMLDSEAEVWSVLEGEAHSAGSLIALSANAGMQVKSHSAMMIHNAKFGVIGTAQNIYDEVEFSKKYLNRIISEVYADFLTEEELNDVLKNKEIWLDEFEIGERIQRMYRTRAERAEEMSGTLAEASLEDAEEAPKKTPANKAAKKTTRKKG